MGRFLGCRRASELFGGHKILLSAFDCEQIGNNLPCHREGGAIAITSLHLLFVNQGQLVALSRGELCGFHQHMLDVFVALFRNGRAQHLVGRALLRSAQPAVTNGLLVPAAISCVGSCGQGLMRISWPKIDLGLYPLQFE